MITPKTFTLMLTKSKRTYTGHSTGKVYRLYIDQAGNFLLFDENNPAIELKRFYCCAQTPISIKINGKKIVELGVGEVYELQPDEVVTHKKFFIQKRFTKV